MHAQVAKTKRFTKFVPAQTLSGKNYMFHAIHTDADDQYNKAKNVFKRTD